MVVPPDQTDGNAGLSGIAFTNASDGTVGTGGGRTVSISSPVRSHVNHPMEVIRDGLARLRWD